ncbi:MAG TPA: hypothetical protein V6C78_12135 [Crinalium sp.]
MPEKALVAVLITTDAERRGVFAGYAYADDLHEIIRTGLVELTHARNCLYWHDTVGGVFGLAATGPNSECRIGALVPRLFLNGVTSVAVMTPEAEVAWREAPVYGQ